MLVMTSLLEQAPDWLTNIRQSSDFSTRAIRASNAQFTPRNLRRLIRANSSAGLSIASLH